MPETSAELEQASVAVAPNLFDVLFDSDQIATLCLSNLLSPAIWETARKIRRQSETAVPGAPPDLPPSIRLIQRHINRNFTHLHPTDVAEIYGLVDLRAERLRFGVNRLDAVLDDLESFFVEFGRGNSALQAVADQIVAWLKEDRFPSYFYSNHDVVAAHRRLTGSSTKSPNGLTSCLDEAAIFLALSAIVPAKGEVLSAMVLSSVSHYGAFGYSADGRRWWFNGKNQLYSKSDWDRMVAELHAGDAQACFDRLFSNFSRMTTVSGTFDFHSGETSIPDVYLAQHLDELRAFFGITLRQVQAGLAAKRTVGPEAGYAAFFGALLGLESREELLRRIDRDPQRWTEHARYCYRSLSVADRRPYLLNARRNPMAIGAARTLSSPQEAIALVGAITGSRSIFDDRDRIAMPDETLRLRTGTDRDKALLLHVLLEEQARVQQRDAQVTSIYADDDSMVGYGGRWWSMMRFETCDEPPPARVRFRF